MNPANTGIDAPPLTDEEAEEVFDATCAADHAQGFRLYLIYARAASIAPLQRELPDE